MQQYSNSVQHIAISVMIPFKSLDKPTLTEKGIVMKKQQVHPPKYKRLNRAERNTIEHLLDKNKSIREIAEVLGRASSTIKREVDRYRTVCAPKARTGELAPKDIEDVCPRFEKWPRSCNGCKRKRGYGCTRSLKIRYDARYADTLANLNLRESRQGIDVSKEEAIFKIRVIDSCIAQGLSPAQIAHTHPELGISSSTIYRWVQNRITNSANIDLPRKVKYKQRKHTVSRSSVRHSHTRSYAAFKALGEEITRSAWEMDTVEGTKHDTQRLLTLHHRPSHFQFVLPIENGSCISVEKALSMICDVLGGKDAMSRIFGIVLTDNGSEFEDEYALAQLFGEHDTPKLFYCDPRRADQKGACEKNHVEVRKLLPKGQGIRFDLLTRKDCSVIMSHMNSSPRGSLAYLSPIAFFKEAFKEDAHTLLDAFGIEEVSIDSINLTDQCINIERAKRGEEKLF